MNISPKDHFLATPRNCHLVGIKGVGMTALAEILKNNGHQVSGSDTKEKFFTDEILRNRKIPFKEGFQKTNLGRNVDLVIYSTAYDPQTHPELIEAKKRAIPLLSYPKAVACLFNNSQGIAVCGTHGKTTTSALIANALWCLKFAPTALIGSKVNNWKSNSLSGKSPYFVIEADEHQDKLRFYNPWSIVLTNIGYDHPDFYPSEKDYLDSFRRFLKKWKKRKTKLPKILVLNGDDEKINRLIKELKLKSKDKEWVGIYSMKHGTRNMEPFFAKGYGRAKHGTLFSHFKKLGNKVFIELNLSLVCHPGLAVPRRTIGDPGSRKIEIAIQTKLLGKHNASNLAAAGTFLALFLLATRGNVSDGELKKSISRSLSDFEGTERRFQYLGEKKNMTIYDDYAHHPDEIAATLKAAKETFRGKKLVVIFHPHTFSRTKQFLQEFAEALSIADQTGVLEIYGSAREQSGDVSSRDIVELLRQKKKQAEYFPTHKEALEFLKSFPSEKPVVLICMGAGDVWKVGKEYLSSRP